MDILHAKTCCTPYRLTGNLSFPGACGSYSFSSRVRTDPNDSTFFSSLISIRFRESKKGKASLKRQNLNSFIVRRSLTLHFKCILSNDLLLEDQDEKFHFDDVPRLTDYLPNLPTYPNPLQEDPAYESVQQYFVESDDIVCKEVEKKASKAGVGVHFRRAGPRQQIYFKGEEVRAAIVTCGGLCPGLNTVIREVVCSLWSQYGVRQIFGISGGYRGFYARNVIPLDPKVVNDLHQRGGTWLGTSRGGHDTSKICNSIEDRGINQVYIIGGDGTQRGAKAIFEECMRRGLKVGLAGIPKTIDNDIGVIDKSFGFDTAVEEAQRAIDAAHVEAESAENGVGLVKLMGRYSGYIAVYATLASRDVDCCLIPEVGFYLKGEGGLFEFIEKRLRENGHLVIVVAEGAGQELLASSLQAMERATDASGNRMLGDIGLWLSCHIKDHFRNNRRTALNLRYIDPTYMIRAIPANASDNIYCTLLAHSAVHSVMAGYTGFTVGPVNGRHALIPIACAIGETNRMRISDPMWAQVLSSTQQPSFICPDTEEEGLTIVSPVPVNANGSANPNGTGIVPKEEEKDGSHGELLAEDVHAVAAHEGSAGNTL